MKTCRICHVEFELSSFGKNKSRKDGLSSECSECRRAEARKRYYHKTEEERKANRVRRKEAIKVSRQKSHRTISGRYRHLQASATKRERELTISLAEYTELVCQSCYYCAGSLPEAGHGLDRIDSTLGYFRENVVPCCTSCNRAKSNLTETEFFHLITAIYENHRLGNQRRA